ncbi:MAG: hypothetical protein ACD_40C00283G0005 [uncultured bacterium]|nr:MAG: hypothetical protein ACD_40C00283G0005 [uncultured bacterium]
MPRAYTLIHGHIDKFSDNDSSDWFLLQTRVVAEQLLNGLPRLKGTYDLSRFKNALEDTMSKDNMDLWGADGVIDVMVEETNDYLEAIEEIRPRDYERYSKAMLADIFRVVYGIGL